MYYISESFLEEASKNKNPSICDTLDPKLKKNITPSGLKKFKMSISRYIDRNSDCLFDIGLTRRLFHSDSEKNAIYELTGISPEEISALIKESNDIKPNFKVATNPFTALSVVAIRHLFKDKKKEDANVVLMNLTLFFYSSSHFKYFRFEPNENVMNYTINNLFNNYKIKQKGNLFGALQDTAQVSNETYIDKFMKDGSDENLLGYINALSVRIDGFVKNIAKEFYQNHDDKKYLNLDKDSYDEDDFHMVDNNSFALDRLVNSIHMKIVKDGIDYRVISLASNISSVSVNELRNTINHLMNNLDKESENIRKVVNVILELFIVTNKNKPQDVRSKKFLYESLMIYKSSNTTDKAILEMRDILDKWLKASSNTYRRTNREATLSNFKKALFTVFVLAIQDYS